MSIQAGTATTLPQSHRRVGLHRAPQPVFISHVERQALSSLRAVEDQLPSWLRTPISDLLDSLDAGRKALTHDEVRTGLAALRWRMSPLFGVEMGAIDRVLQQGAGLRILPTRATAEGLAELCDLAFAGLSLAFQEHVVLGEHADEVPRWTRLEEQLSAALVRGDMASQP